MRLTLVAGARPNFVKIAPLIHEIEYRKKQGKDITYRLIHTGQHYDYALSGKFFEDLEIPQPHSNLNCGGGSQAEQTAQILIAFEKELIHNPTDFVVVVGDVNSTLACSITAKKMNLQLVHIEAGIRSDDMTMPEEINRIVTDSLSDYLFTTTLSANENLIRMGKEAQRIFFVGNIMIDTLLKFQSKFKMPGVYNENHLKSQQYLVLTLHRPSNVDEENELQNLLQYIAKIAHPLPIIFPIHPRTQNVINQTSIPDNIIITAPLGYLEFNYLMQHSLGVLTDSGGITEETTVMNIPCITLRSNTERPETIYSGTNVLVGRDQEKIKTYLNRMISGHWKEAQPIKYWDGKTAERIVDVLLNDF